MVMLVHSAENFYCVTFDEAMLANESNRLWVSLYDGFLGRVSVPLFIIVSAFLLVPMPEGMTMRQFYRRRFMRILPPMICFLLLYALLPLAWGGTTWEQAMADLRMVPFNFPPMAGHLWFMYPLISIYLIIPVVSPWLERASARDERLFLLFFVVSTLLPLAPSFCLTHHLGRMPLEPVLCPVVLLGLPGLRGAGALHPCASEVVAAPTSDNRHHLFHRRRGIHGMEFLDERSAGCSDAHP